MSAGIVEVIALLLALGGFGIDANPKAPSATEVLKFAPDGADGMLHVDLSAIVPRNYAALVALPKRADIAGTEVAGELSAGIGKIAMGVGLVKTMTGVDLTSDVHSLTLWSRLPDAGDPQLLLVARGKLPANLIERLSDKAPTRTIGEALVLEPEPGFLVGRAHDGSIIAGSESWVTPRLVKSWKPVKVRSGAGVAAVASVLREKPFLAMISAPSESARRRATSDLDREAQVVIDLVDGHELAALYFTHDGLGWQWSARDAAGGQRAEVASKGLIEMMRAAQHGTRGFIELTFATLPSYRHLEPVAAVLDREKAIRALLASWTGDGEFRARVRRRGNTVSVSARGKSFSEVAPAAVFAVLGGVGAFLASRSDSMQPAEAVAATPTQVTRPEPAPRTLDLRRSFERARDRVRAAP